MKINVRVLLSAIVFIVVLVAVFVALNKGGNNQIAAAVITFKNVGDVNIYDISESQDRVDKILVGNIEKSGEVIRLGRDRLYLITYKGGQGYESGEIPFDMSKGDRKINIIPYYSNDKLESLLSSEQQGILQALTDKYPSIGLYTIQPGRLYHYGEWYGTRLTYRGEDLFNSDELRIVLRKEDGAWKVVTDPPNITLSKFLYPSIPVDILRDVNNFL
jgi:hypothetical protein